VVGLPPQKLVTAAATHKTQEWPCDPNISDAQFTRRVARAGIRDGGRSGLASPRLGSAPEPNGRLTHGRPQQRWNPRNARSQARVWPAAVVLTDPLSKNRANVPFAHRNHEVQAFAADRADHACAEGIRLWRTHRCFQDAQAHRLKRAVNAFRVDRVAIVDDESMHLVVGDDHPELLRGPVCRRMRGHVPLENAPRADLQYYEHVHDAEGRCGPPSIASAANCSRLFTIVHKPETASELTA